MDAANKAFLKRDFYDMYYDQSHFIKDFKRFTGLPPTRFEKQVNDFGEKYFRNWGLKFCLFAACLSRPAYLNNEGIILFLLVNHEINYRPWQ